MKTGKRVWSALLALVLVFGMIVPVHAEGEAVITGFTVDPITVTREAANAATTFFDLIPVDTDSETKEGSVQMRVITADNAMSGTLLAMQITYPGLTLSDGTGRTDNTQWVSDYAYKWPLVVTYDGQTYETFCTVKVVENEGDTFVSHPVSFTVADVTMSAKDMSTLTYDNGTSVQVYDPEIMNPLVTVTYNQEGYVRTFNALSMQAESNNKLVLGHVQDLATTNSWTVSETPYAWEVSLVDPTTGQSVCENTYTMNITVKAEPKITGVTVSDVVMFEGAAYYVDDGEGGQFLYFDVAGQRPDVVLNYEDGTSASYTYDQLWSLGYSLQDVDYNQNWSAGNTYQWPMVLVDGNEQVAQTTVNVAVYAEGKVPEGIGPVPVRVEVADVTMSEDDAIVTQNPDGTVTEHYDLYMANPLVTIHYSDGTSQSVNLLDMRSTGYQISVSHMPVSEWAVGTHTATTYLTDVKSYARVTPDCEYQVTIEARPITITGISVDPISMKENEKQSIVLADGTEGYIFNPRDKNPQITIYYSDGTNQVHYWNDLPETTPYSVGYTSPNGLLDTMGWTAGNTYEFPIALMTDVNDNSTIAATYTVQIDILPPELEVTGITVAPVTMIQGLEQTLHADTQGEFLGYNIREKNPTITVTYNDGTTYQGTWQDFENQGKGSIGYTAVDTKTWAEPGTYTQKVWIGDAETQVSVTLTENPVASVIFQPVTMMMGIDTVNWGFPDGSNADVYDFAWLGNPEMTVTFSDGREPLETYWWGISQHGYNMPEYYDDMRDTADWGVGEHTFKVWALGKIVDVTVNIVEDPIKSVTVSEGILTEAVDRYEDIFWNGETQEEEKLNVLNLHRANTVITVTYKDGTVKSGTIRELEEAGIRVGFDQDIAATAKWTAGSTYEVTYVVENHRVTGKIKLVPNPNKSVSVAPVTIKVSQQQEGMEWDEQTQAPVFFRPFYEVKAFALVTVTKTDGTTQTLSCEELRNMGNEVRIDTDQTAAAPWQGGKTYTATFEGLGHKVEFPVTIVDDTIKDISIKAQYPLYEDLSAYADSVWEVAPIATLVRNDGTTNTFPLDMLGEYLTQAELDSFNGLEVPDAETWELAAGTHTAALILGEKSYTFPITVLENPVKDIKLTTRYPFVEGVHGFVDYDYSGEVEFFRYDYHFVDYTIQLTLKDGTVENYGSPEELYEKYRIMYFPMIECDATTVPGPGNYTVDVDFMGMKTKQSITVIPSSIKSITAVNKGAPLVENVHGEESWEWDETAGETKEFFYYNADERYLEFTVTYTDGTTETLGYHDRLLGTNIAEAVWLETNQTLSTPWKVGKNKATVSLLGFEMEVTYEVVKNEIEKISAKATRELVDGWHDFYNGRTGKYYYDLEYAYPQVTLTYTDGTEEVYSLTALNEKFGGVAVTELTKTGPGKKTVWLDAAGQECSFEVTVVENPVDSITAKPSRTLTEGYLGLTKDLLYLDGQYYTFYNYVPQDTKPVYTITMTDGTVYTLYGDDQVFEKFHFYPDMEGMTPDKPWGVGKHTVQVELMGKVFDYTFEIVKAPNPLVKITAKATGKLYENVDVYTNQRYEYEALVEITQHFKDGTTKTVMANKELDEFGRNAVDFVDTQSGEPWGVGTHKATASYKGLEAEFEIEVIANPYKTLEISNEDGFTVTLKRADGSKTVWKASDFQVRNIYDLGCEGNLVTDQGTFFVSFRYTSGQESEITYMEYQGLRSNSLSGCSWLDQRLTTETVGDVPEFQMDIKESAEENTDATAQAMKDLVASEADEVRGGVTRVWMTVTEVSAEDLTEEENKEVEKALDSLEDHEAGIVLDLSIYKQYPSGETTKVSETHKPVVITMAVPQSLIDSGAALAEFKVIRVHNGVAEILDTVYDKENQTITFETGSFSAYSLTYSAHNLTKVEAKAPTCTEAGNDAYYTCSHCDKLFADSAAKTETTKAAVTKAATGHTTLTKVEEKAATETAEGVKAHYKCTCGALFADAEGKKTVTAAELVIPKVEKQPEETKPEETKPEESKPEETKPEESKPEETKPAEKPSDGSNAQTGDSTPIGLLMLLAVISGLLLAGEVLFGKKRFW